MHRRKPDHRVPVVLQKPCSDRVTRGPFGGVVREAVDFDGQLSRQAAEVHHVWSDRVLAPEFQAV